MVKRAYKDVVKQLLQAKEDIERVFNSTTNITQYMKITTLAGVCVQYNHLYTGVREKLRPWTEYSLAMSRSEAIAYDKNATADEKIKAKADLAIKKALLSQRVEEDEYLAFGKACRDFLEQTKKWNELDRKEGGGANEARYRTTMAGQQEH